jgi:glycosyltransferase involved in cell wall biosynthesis
VRVLIVSGIWPPDVGGPASHAPALAAFLHERGHAVQVVTTAAAEPEPQPFPISWVSRSLPRGTRHARAAALVATVARRADVVYTTGMFGRSALGARLARRPYVLKLTADPAFERAVRGGLTGDDLEAFQKVRRGLRIRALRAARDREVRGAAHVFCPSAYLRELAIRWGVPAARVSVLPNPTPSLPPLAEPQAVRRELGVNGRVLVFAGRLTAQKALGVALEALALTDEVSLVVVGDGPDRPELERRAAELHLGSRALFLGAQPRQRVLELFHAADAALLSSTWENFPHALVEALAVGTPVIASQVGGVPEIVEDGKNGLLVEPGDADALAARINEFFASPELQHRLAAAAAPSVKRFAPERIFGELERVLIEAAG